MQSRLKQVSEQELRWKSHIWIRNVTFKVVKCPRHSSRWKHHNSIRRRTQIRSLVAVGKRIKIRVSSSGEQWLLEIGFKWTKTSLIYGRYPQQRRRVDRVSIKLDPRWALLQHLGDLNPTVLKPREHPSSSRNPSHSHRIRLRTERRVLRQSHPYL